MGTHITFRPIGRTGNLMFQCAAAIGHAKKHGLTWGVPIDTGEVPHFHKMFPGLPIADGSFHTYQEHPNYQCKIHHMHYDQCHFNYHEIPRHDYPIKLLGFYQSWKYFENAQEEVKQAFKLDFIPGYEDYVSIHVRRGDYVKHANSFPPVTVEYINEAIMKFPWATKLMVFSDDIEWCKKSISHLQDMEFSEGRNEFEDLSLMASCGHHIIANSTFSWWGAWLGHNPERIVISPSCERGNWFGMESGVKHDCIDLLPPSWHQIKFR